jgi:hypothetical protein
LGPAWASRRHISRTPVLEYHPTEILPPVGAIIETPCASLPTGRQASRAHPRGKPGFSTCENGFGRETDSPLEEEGFEPSVPRSLISNSLKWRAMIRGPTRNQGRFPATIGDPLADFAYHAMAWRVTPELFRGLAGIDLAALGIPTEDDNSQSNCEVASLAASTFFTRSSIAPRSSCSTPWSLSSSWLQSIRLQLGRLTILSNSSTLTP